jgi:hypothetical protein
MENNKNWDDILNDINGNVPQPPNNEWRYEWACSPEYVCYITRTIFLLCKSPFQEQIKQMLTETGKSDINDEDIKKAVDFAWVKFIASVKLPGVSFHIVPIFIGENIPFVNEDSVVWKVTLNHLQEVGMDIIEFQDAIENDLPHPEDKERVRQLLCSIYQLKSFIITDGTLHATYKTIVDRVDSLARNKRDYLFSYMRSNLSKAEGHKYDEAETVELFCELLTSKEVLLDGFFNVKGKSLSKLLPKAFELLDQVGASEKGKQDNP